MPRIITSSIAVGALALAGALSIAPANAATLTVCASGCTHTTVASAVTAAAAGDTIDIKAGTYPAFGITVDKPLTIKGAGAGTTILDGGGASVGSVPGIFRILPGLPAKGAGAITVEDMTLRNPGKNTTATQYMTLSIAVKQLTTGITAINLDSLDIEGTGDVTKRGYGVYADGGLTGGVDRQFPSLNITNSSISKTANQNAGVDAWLGPVDISNNKLTETLDGRSALVLLNEYTKKPQSEPVTITGNEVNGRLISVQNIRNATPSLVYLREMSGWTNLTIDNNKLTGLAATDFGIYVGTVSDTGDAHTRISGVKIRNNEIRGDGSAAGTVGIHLVGEILDATVTENNIVGVGSAVTVAPMTTFQPGKIDIHRNRLFANGAGVTNTSSATVDASVNWWGCAEDPGTAGEDCSQASNDGAGAITTAPWIRPTLTPAKDTVETEESTTVTTEMGLSDDSAAPALPSFLQDLPTTFDTDLGTVAAEGAWGEAKFTAPNTTGTATVTVQVDKETFEGVAPLARMAPGYGTSGTILGVPVATQIKIVAKASPSPSPTPTPTAEPSTDPTDEPGEDPADSSSPGSGKDLPNTGAPSLELPILGGLLLLLGGALLMDRARRRRA